MSQRTTGTIGERKQQLIERHTNGANGDGCIEWQSAKLPTGYGQFTLGIDGESIQFYAHRATWEVNFGEIPEGLQVCHICDNPPCVNPNHLFLATQKVNSMDMVRKGRTYAASDEHQELHNDIRDDYLNTRITKRGLCEKYDFTYAVINDVLYLRNRKHILMPDDLGRYLIMVKRKDVLYDPPRKLSGILALWIRKLYQTGDYTYYDLGDMFEIDFTYVSHIMHWRRPIGIGQLCRDFTAYALDEIEGSDHWLDLAYGL